MKIFGVFDWKNRNKTEYFQNIFDDQEMSLEVRTQSGEDCVQYI